MADALARDRTGDIGTLLDLEEPRWKRWGSLALRLLAVVLAAALLIGGFLYFRGQRAASEPRFVTEQVTRGNLHVVVTATGSVQPTDKVDVSSELSGTVRRVFVDYNSPVKAGQVLAELDTDKLLATVENSRAKLEAARANLRVAEVTVWETEREWKRKQELAEKRISSTHDREVAEALYRRAAASYESAKAAVGVADSELRLNETNLGKASITSPIDGTVLRRNIDPGQTVAASFQAPVLFSIAQNLTRMDAQIDVDEADVGQVAVGQAATFTVDAYPDRKFPATIRELYFDSEVVQGVVTYKALLTVDNADLALRPGMTVTAQIAVKEVTDAVLVPNTALRFAPPEVVPQQDKPSLLRRVLPGPPQFRPPAGREEAGSARRVWVLRDGKPAPISVRIGASDGRHTEILEGKIQPDQAVIVDTAVAS